MKQDGEMALENVENGWEEFTVVQKWLNEEANKLVSKIEDGIIKDAEQKIQLNLVKIE